MISGGKESENSKVNQLYFLKLIYVVQKFLYCLFSIKSMLNYWINNLITLSTKNLKYLNYINYL